MINVAFQGYNTGYRYKGLSLLEPDTGKSGTWTSQDEEARKKEPGRLERERLTLSVNEMLILCCGINVTVYPLLSICERKLTLPCQEVIVGYKGSVGYSCCHTCLQSDHSDPSSPETVGRWNFLDQRKIDRTEPVIKPKVKGGAKRHKVQYSILTMNIIVLVNC